MFGPVSPSPIRLKSRAGASGSARLAVAQREHRQLVAVEELLDDHGLVAEAALDQHRLERGAGLALVRGDHDALARGQAVGLDHGRIAGDRGHPGLDSRVTTACAAVGTPAASHDLLRVRLRALQARGGRERARSSATPAAAQRVGEPGDERRLRADHDSSTPAAAAARRAPSVARRATSSAPASRRMPGVAGRAQHLRALRRAQRARARARARARREPTTRTASQRGDEVVDRDRGQRLVAARCRASPARARRAPSSSRRAPRRR